MPSIITINRVALPREIRTLAAYRVSERYDNIDYGLRSLRKKKIKRRTRDTLEAGYFHGGGYTEKRSLIFGTVITGWDVTSTQ